MRKIWLILGVILLALCCVTQSGCFFHPHQCLPIGKGGFGDSANSYCWGLNERDGCLYAGTNRHHLWSLMLAFERFGLFPDGLLDEIAPPGPANEEWGHPDFANAMRGEIRRHSPTSPTPAWEVVHRSDLWYLPIDLVIDIPGGDPVTVPAGFYPTAYGYRVIGKFNGYIYAMGVGTWMPPIPFTSIIRSLTGDAGTWEDVTGILGWGPAKLNTNNPRAMIQYKDKLYISASIPGLSPPIGGGGVVFCTSDPAVDGWTPVSLAGFGNLDNAEIYHFEVFNDHLYASTVNFNTGFEVWKTDGTIDPDDPDGKRYLWTCVLKDGFGDTWNQYGMSLQVFKDHLIVGTAVGAGMVQKDNQPVGTRPFELIRIDKDDNAELLMGSYFAYDPPPGWPLLRTPLSKWPAGFGNFLNVYAWHMEVHNDCLYVATFDATEPILTGLPLLLSSGFLTAETILRGVQELLDAFDNIPDLTPYKDYITYILSKLNLQVLLAFQKPIVKNLGGADLWKTSDGINWNPVTLNGCDNPKNYGIRRLLSWGHYLVVGTANPSTGDPNGGCEVLLLMEEE